MHIFIIGGGAMGRSLYDGWLKASWQENKITIIDQNPDLCIGDFTHIKLKNRNPMMIVIAVKPQHVASVLTQYSDVIKPSDIIVSIAAGVTLTKLNSLAPPATTVMRAMPNTAVRLQKGAIALCAGSRVGDKTINQVIEIFSKIGQALLIDEKQIDAFTALAGSGPAYFFQFIEHLTSAADNLGLPQQVAHKMAIQTAIGSAALLAESHITPKALREQVTSPAGTTEAGLKALNADGDFKKLVNNCLTAAALRSQQLSKI